MSAPVLVTGGTGKTGRRVAERLEAAGRTVRRASRSTPVRLDWEDPSTWDAALAGVASVYLAYAPDLAAPGVPERVAAFAERARLAGVSRLVVLSGRGEHGARASEQAALASGVAATVVRASWFAQNFTEGVLHGMVLDGVIALPAGAVREPFVDVDDIANVAAAVLAAPEGPSRHDGRIYEVTGPQLLDFHEAAAVIARASGLPVRYEPVAFDDFRAALAPLIGDDDAQMLTELCREVFDGRNESLTDGVLQAIGLAPRSFEDVCRAAAAAGAWQAAHATA